MDLGPRDFNFDIKAQVLWQHSSRLGKSIALMAGKWPSNGPVVLFEVQQLPKAEISATIPCHHQ
jgi:hypothetical protein